MTDLWLKEMFGQSFIQLINDFPDWHTLGTLDPGMESRIKLLQQMQVTMLATYKQQ